MSVPTTDDELTSLSTTYGIKVDLVFNPTDPTFKEMMPSTLDDYHLPELPFIGNLNGASSSSESST